MDIESAAQERKDEYPQADILSQFPREIILKIFSFLSFQDLIKIQLTCQLWHRLVSDVSVWKSRFQGLNSRITDIYAHNAVKLSESSSLSWQRRYCQAITFANWRTGSVQRLIKINADDSDSRILSNNSVRLYQYNSDSGFSFKHKWYFGDPLLASNIVECIDILPEINVLVIAQRGSRCVFYNINKPKQKPIQTLKGGCHLLFVPDSIAISKDYFAVAGRKPSIIFLWNWRKGIRLSSITIDNQPHHVFLSEDNLITISSNGLLEVFNIFDYSDQPVTTHRINPCSIPCIEYNNSLSIISAPHQSKRIYHYQWSPSDEQLKTQNTKKNTRELNTNLPLVSSAHIPKSRKRFSSTFINLLGLKSNISNNDQSQSKTHSTNSSTHSTKPIYPRHYSYQQSSKLAKFPKDKNQIKDEILPNFEQGPKLVHSIYTAPLCSSASHVVGVALYQDRIATVNRQGMIALYALNGTTASSVNTMLSTTDVNQEWVDSDKKYNRDDDDLSDGYDFVRSRLAMGSMGLVYGGRSGSLWWLDFGCRAA